MSSVSSHSIHDYLRRASELTGLIMQALEVIARLTKTTKDDQAVAALKSISSIVEVLRNGMEGAVSPSAIEDEIKKLRSAVLLSDEKTLAALREKFGVRAGSDD